MEEITVEINPQGEVKVSVKGVKGKSCTMLTKELEAALGDIEHTQVTREFIEHEQTTGILNRNRA